MEECCHVNQTSVPIVSCHCRRFVPDQLSHEYLASSHAGWGLFVDDLALILIVD